MSTQTNGLMAKLAQIQAEVGATKKKGRNAHFNYAYFTEAQLMGDFRKKLADHGIVILPSVETITSTPIKDGKRQTVTVTTSYLITDSETGEQFTVKGAGMGTDDEDKGVYKAITGAYKYFLMKLFLISDEQDPESGFGGARGSGESAGTGRHAPTKDYDQRGAKGVPAAEADIANIRKWLKDKKIIEPFLISCLVDAKLAKDGDTLDDLKPGVLVRVLKPKAMEKVETKWAAFNAKEGAAAERKAPQKKQERRVDASESQEGGRKPAQSDLSPEDFLAQEGIENWKDVKIHWGDDKGKTLGELSERSLATYWIAKWVPKPFRGSLTDDDLLLDAALCVADAERRQS